MEADAEIRRLRTAMRDLVALSTIPAAWVGREPSAIAGALADVLTRSLQLDFAFVRLCDPSGGAAVEVMRGDVCEECPEWLQRHLAARRLSGREIIPHFGGAAPYRGILIPIGIDGEGGLVAAACDRQQFPTEIDQLLLSVAANHAATAFQHARLAEELRHARDGFEMKVSERTAELRQSEAALRAQASLLDLTHDAIFVWEFRRAITYWNRAAEQLYGYSRHEAVGRLSHELLHTEHPVPVQVFEAALERDGNWTGELTHTTRDGRQIMVESRHVLMRHADGRLLVLETNRDITERRRAEDAMRKAQADLAHVGRVTTMGQMAASIAHEVNQPLSGVVINANACLRWLAGGTPNLDEARDALQRIVRDGKRANDVIARIRGLSKKTGGEKERLDLNEAIREVAALAESEVRRNGVALRIELARGLPHVLGDRVQLQQVVLNLLLNAVEAMSTVLDRPKELLIATRMDEAECVHVVVQDSGTGLEPSDVSRIFDAFYTTKRGGMGMGLSISRSIVENHGGRLWAVSNDGHGTTFQFTVSSCDV